MKRFSWIGVLALMAGATLGPAAAFADEGELYAAADFQWLGTVETVAVTAPITVDVITYIPGAAVGGGMGELPFFGTVQTDAVTGPITIGGITYIPFG